MLDACLTLSLSPCVVWSTVYSYVNKHTQNIYTHTHTCVHTQAVRHAEDPIANIEGDVTEKKLFEALDTDGSSQMSFYDFEVASKYFTFPKRLTKISMMKFFKIADKADTNRLNLFQFGVSLDKFREALASHVLEQRGQSDTYYITSKRRNIWIPYAQGCDLS